MTKVFHTPSQDAKSGKMMAWMKRAIIPLKDMIIPTDCVAKPRPPGMSKDERAVPLVFSVTRSS